MTLHKDNKMVFFCNLLAKHFTLEGDWRVDLAEIISFQGIEKITAKDLLSCTHKVLHDNALNVITDSAIKRDDEHILFCDDELITVVELLSPLHFTANDKRPILTSIESPEVSFVDIKF